jgi:general stress protein YciG
LGWHKVTARSETRVAGGGGTHRHRAEAATEVITVTENEMTVREAGRKGGETTKKRYGPRFYEEIGKKGGHKVKRMIEASKRARKRTEPVKRKTA